MPRFPGVPALALLLVLPLAACSAAERSTTPVPGEPAPAGASPTPGASAPPATSAAPETAPSVTDGRDLPEVLADTLRRGPRPARSPSELVAQVRAAERAITDSATDRKVLAAAGHLQQVAYRVLARHPGWDERVFRALPRELRWVVRHNVRSRREFEAMQHQLSGTLPAWRIVAPIPAHRLKSHYLRAERRSGVDWEYLAAINLVETGMGRIRGTSVAGARGPMQFLPSTWEIYGRGDIDSVPDAIMAAGRFLAAHGFTEPGGIDDALYRYNNSERYVRGVRHLARVMQRRPRAFLGYYHWEIYYRTTRGDVHLPVGYAAQQPIPVRRWLSQHPRR